MSTLKRLIMSKPMTWLSRSLLGNIVLSGIVMGIPTLLAFSYKSYEQGILSPDRVVDLFFIAAVQSAVFGCFVWFAIAKPAMDRKEKR